MKNLRWLLTILISIGIGIVISQTFLKKDTIHTEKQEGHHEEVNEVELSKKSQELIELKTIEARFAPLKKAISVMGQIASDPEYSIHVVTPQAGVIVECKAEIGSMVKEDDVLCIVKTNAENSLLEIKSSISGVIIGDFAKVGNKVDSVSSIYTVADLSKLWANFDVYEKDISAVRLGQKVSVHSIAYPEKSFDGKIIFISPMVDETTRTIKIRALIENIDNLLKLKMFVTGEVISEGEERYLTLPSKAVQIIGDKKVVFVKFNDGKFQMKEVRIILETKDEVAISDGLQEGEQVVTEGAFLLKSELLKGELEEE